MRFPAFILPSLLASCAGPAIGWRDVGPPAARADAALRGYKDAHYRDLGTSLSLGPPTEELISAIREVHVLYLGDQHLDAALHADHLALLERLAASGVRMQLGLEAIGAQDEPAVQAWLRGHATLDELRTVVRARWPGSWLDGQQVDAGHYRALLQFAQRSRSGVFALEPTPRLPLRYRDAEIAARVAAAVDRAAPNVVTVVIVGHTHLLGTGAVVRRVGAPAVVIGARLSDALRATLPRDPWPADRYMRSDAGVLFPPAAR